MGATRWKEEMRLRMQSRSVESCDREAIRRVFFVTLARMFLVTLVEVGWGVVPLLGMFDVVLFP